MPFSSAQEIENSVESHLLSAASEEIKSRKEKHTPGFVVPQDDSMPMRMDRGQQFDLVEKDLLEAGRQDWVANPSGTTIRWLKELVGKVSNFGGKHEEEANRAVKQAFFSILSKRWQKGDRADEFLPTSEKTEKELAAKSLHDEFDKRLKMHAEAQGKSPVDLLQGELESLQQKKPTPFFSDVVLWLEQKEKLDTMQATPRARGALIDYAVDVARETGHTPLIDQMMGIIQPAGRSRA